ncbi:hypothetical protein Tco_1148400 [Tanacetum coccineum]
MSKTRADYRSGVARPKIEDKDNFELKAQFLKELRTNTFSGSDHEDANKHIEKFFKIVDLFHIPNFTIDQVMLRAFPIKYCPPARTAKKMEEINNFQQEPDENLYEAWERFKKLILDSRGTIPSKTVADVKVAIQEMVEYSQKYHNETSRARSTETSDGLVAIQAQLNNLGREIKNVNEKVYAAQVGCKQCKGPHYTKDYPLKEEEKTLEEAYYTQLGAPFQGGGYKAIALMEQHESFIPRTKMSKVLQERGFVSLPSSTETNPRDHVKSISTIVEADSYPIRRIGSSQYVVSTGQNCTLMYKTKQMTIPFPSRLNAYYYEEKKGSYGP